jgi:hypothetical protein
MTEPGHTRNRVDLFCVIAVGVAVILFFGPAWRAPESLWYAPQALHSDLTISHWPIWWFVAQSTRQEGQVPLWQPWIMGGAPLAGNPLAGLFYPPNWLFFLLPVTPTFHMLFALHLAGAGIALYGFARWGYGCSPFAAFIGGLGYALSPKLIAHLSAGHVGILQATCWLPLAAWLLHGATEPCAIGESPEGNRACLRRARRRALGCGTALALAYLADPRVALLGALLLVAYALYRLIGVWRREGTRGLLTLVLQLAFAPLATLSVAAVQALPTLEFMRTLTRATLSVQEASHASLPWRYLSGYLLADWGGYHEWMTYLGLIPLGLGLLALWRSVEPDRWFWLGLILVAVTFSLGLSTPLYPLLFRLLPGLAWMRVPPRALLLVVLAANLLAALGADALLAGHRAERTTHRVRRLSLFAMLTFAGLGIGFAWLWGRGTPPAAWLLAGAGTAGCLAWFLSTQPGVPQAAIQTLLALTLICELWLVGHSLIELRTPDQVWSEGLAAASTLAAQHPPVGRPFRVYSPSYSIPQHTGVRVGLEQLNGVDPSQVHWLAAFMSLAGGYPLSSYGVTIPAFPPHADVRSVWRTATPDARLLGLLNGCYVVAEFPIEAKGLVPQGRAGSSYIYRNEHCRPRAFTQMRTEPVSGWREAQARLGAGHNATHSALVEPGTGTAPIALDGPPGWEAAVLSDTSPNRLVVEAEVSQSALLVLGEVWYPGWKATVDGIEKPIFRVNGVQRGVYLDPGAHQVVWTYRPASLRWGAMASLSGLALCVLILLHTRTRPTPGTSA